MDHMADAWSLKGDVLKPQKVGHVFSIPVTNIAIASYVLACHTALLLVKKKWIATLLAV